MLVSTKSKPMFVCLLTYLLTDLLTYGHTDADGALRCECGVLVDLWPQSTCHCVASCSQSQLTWDFSFAQLSPSSLLFHSDDHPAQSTPAATVVVGLRCEAADAVARRSLAADTDHISALGVALDRLTNLADRLRSELGRVARRGRRK